MNDALPTDDGGAFRHLADALPYGLLVHREFQPLYANPAAAAMFGFDDAAALLTAGKIDKLFAEGALDRLSALAPPASAANADQSVSARRLDGRPIVLAVRPIEVDWSDGKAIAITLVDVTHQESADLALRDSEASYRRLFENVPNGVFRITEEGEILESNPALIRMLGYEDADAVGLAFSGPDGSVFVDDDGWAKIAERLKRDGRARDHEVQWRCRNGAIIWVTLNLTAVPGASGAKVIEGSAVEITEQRNVQLSLLRAKEAAELSNRAKSEFLAHMSHELRTPLNCVIGFSQILMNEMFGPLGRDSYREYAADIHTAGHHLLGLISDVLDISKIEAGEFEIFDAPVDIGAVLINCMTMMRDRADSAGVTVAVEFDHDLPQLMADELRIKQIILNLLSNSIKFTPPAGAVRVSANIEANGDMMLSVSDTGIGIAPENLERVLAPFEQVRSATTLTHEGTGLGLYLVKTLSEMHQGRVEVTSEPGKGTRVSVRLPATRVLPASSQGGT